MMAKLPKQTEEHIRTLIDSGEFVDSEAVLIRAVADLARRREQASKLRAFLQPSMDQVDRGETIPLSQKLLDQKWESVLATYHGMTGKDQRGAS